MTANDQKKPTKVAKDLLRPHSVDGIQEYDNPLPRWWTAFLYGSIVFSVIYLIVYHVLGYQSLEAAYARSVKKQQAVAQDAAATHATAGDSDLASHLKDPAAIASGKEVFTTYCAPCHGAAAEGNIGPNLTDQYWIHGGTPTAVIATITNGAPEKGMPAWGAVVGDKKVEHVAAYVLSLRGSNPPNAKAPQGELQSEP